jgi:hypothetical protein
MAGHSFQGPISAYRSIMAHCEAFERGMLSLSDPMIRLLWAIRLAFIVGEVRKALVKMHTSMNKNEKDNMIFIKKLIPRSVQT